MPESPRRLRAPSPRRFAAGALASFVAVFGVLALRVHDGDDPALAPSASVSKATTTASDTSDSTAASSDDSSSAAATPSDDSSGAVSSTPSASTSAS